METLERNIRKAIRQAIRQGTVGMSLENLKQITPTTGLTCNVQAYHRFFPGIALTVAKKLHFNLY